MICSSMEHWSVCSQKVKNSIIAASTPEQAFAIADEWAIRYRRLYDANTAKSWSKTDQDRMEDAMSLLFDESIGKYLDPSQIAIEAALTKYFPRLSAMLGLFSSPIVVAFYGLLAPSPTSNEFTAATPINQEINEILSKKLDTFLPADWRSSYSSMIDSSYQKVKSTRLP